MKRLYKIIYIKLLTIVGIASIYDGKHWYRVTGFYYRYQYADGRYRDPKPCHRFFANAIGGYGISGWYPLIEHVVAFRLDLRKQRLFFFRQHLNHLWWSLWNPDNYRSLIYKYKIGFQISRMPKLMYEQQYEDYILDKAVKSALKSMPR